jgi:hypothetical protein
MERWGVREGERKDHQVWVHRIAGVRGEKVRKGRGIKKITRSGLTV